MTLREKHAGAGIEGIIDAPRALHGEALRVGVAPRVHIGVAHLAPEMRRALFHRAHEFGDAQRIGQPFQLDAVFLLEFEQPLVGDERVGALVVGVDAYAWLCHRVPCLDRAIVSDPNDGSNPRKPDRLLGCHRNKRMGPGAFKQRGALHLRFRRRISGRHQCIFKIESAWPLRSDPADMFGFLGSATGLAAAVHPICVETLPLSKVTGLAGGIMLLSKSGPDGHMSASAACRSTT